MGESSLGASNPKPPGAPVWSSVCVLGHDTVMLTVFARAHTDTRSAKDGP